MTSLKQFMDWVTVSNRISSQNHADPRRRLLLAYLMVMATILGISATALYFVFARSLHQHSNNRLLTLVQAATPSLDEVKTNGRQSLDEDLPWRDLFSGRQQSLEWYGPDGKLLTREGRGFPRSPLVKKILSSSLEDGSPIFQKENQVRSVTIAVYSNQANDSVFKLKGYIRASESTRENESTLNKLRLGLMLGGATALLFISVSSIYLTQRAFEPTFKSYQQLKQFAADASHELGNPLTKITFATDILLSNPAQFRRAAELKKLQIIKSAADQMKHLLEDLLFLARTDAASIANQSEKVTIYLDELLQQLAESFKAIAQTKEIDFYTDLQRRLTIKGDGSQLNRLFTNLLENAFKYTEPGGKVDLSLSHSQQNAVIVVKDTGIGIAAEYLPYIFQRFWRAERVRKSKREGLGLGLAICQAIAQQHGGTITVSSQVGVGTSFQVYLPLV